MPEAIGREQDLVLDPRQYTFVLDSTKGTIMVHAGPCSVTLAQQHQPVSYDGKSFQRVVRLEDAVQQCPVAEEGDYIELVNPARGEQEHPTLGTGNQQGAELRMGQKKNVPGPVSFVLWPGQVARVIPGHDLHSNQYLVARVYNEERARQDLERMVLKPADASGGEDKDKDEKTTAPVPQQDNVRAQIGAELTMGKLLVIKGTETSFFIPPTGIEVLPDENAGKKREVGDDGEVYVRDAVSLEALEYAILVDENGEKRYEHGPAVVFPKPTERFRRSKGKDGTPGSRKFRAIELNEISGIHVKVISDYEDKGHPLKNFNGDPVTEFAEGDEFFITGDDQRIYYPRAEHATVTYGEGGDGRVFAVAVPEGEGRYVMDRLGKGERLVRLVKGPKMLLPDPRREVMVRRILTEHNCRLMFPNSPQALKHNLRLQQAATQASGEHRAGEGMVSEGAVQALYSAMASEAEPMMKGLLHEQLTGSGIKASASSRRKARSRTPQSEYASEDFVGDEVRRKTEYTPPRTLTLDTKYEGAVCIDVWTNYAVLVKDKRGNREVIVGPATRLLEYDEGLEMLSLSTGKPKNTDNLKGTVYLQVHNNKVSDIIENVETADLVPVSIKVSYRVNFTGDDPERWFAVENYVKYLCDHIRSMVRNHVKKLTVEQFVDDAVAHIRDMVLGESQALIQEIETGEPREDGAKARPGVFFEENNCHVYDVEVLDVQIGDATISDLLIKARHEAVRQTIGIKEARRQLEATKESEEIQRQTALAQAETARALYKIAMEKRELEDKIVLAEITAQTEREKEKLNTEKARQTMLDEQASGALERVQANEEQRLTLEAAAREQQTIADRQANEVNIEAERNRSEIRATEAQKLADAIKSELEAMTPQLVSALQTHGDKMVTAVLVEKMAPIASITGEGVDTVGKRILRGTVLGDILEGIKGNGKMGTFARPVVAGVLADGSDSESAGE